MFRLTAKLIGLLKRASVIACLVLTAIAGPVSPNRDSKFVGFTTKLPPIDKVELQEVEANELWIKRVLATKTIEGREADSVARLWRSQKYGGMGNACHYPVYAIKFYSKGKSIAYASLCWECKNIIFVEPDLNDSLGFAANNARGRQLLAVFKKAFPR
jgi:hypothetical protein